MKKVLKYIIAAMCMGTMATGCLETPELIESIDYVRCLTPLNLSVKIIDGDQVTFRWDAVKGADQYQLEVYSDEAMTALVTEELVDASKLPVTIKLTADSEYWFRVMAIDSSNKLEPSKWAVYDESVKTYAVKPTVYPAVSDRTESSITVSWDAEAAAGEVDAVKYRVLGSEEVFTKTLEAAEITAAKATISGLEPFTNYVVSVYFKSANRGDISVWTRSNTEGYTKITTAAALTQAFKDGGKYTLAIEGSPYEIGAADVAAGIEIIGEESVEGSQPVIQGELHVLSTVPENASFIFKSLELNGVAESYGFPWQLKNGGAGKGQVFDKIHFIGCKIAGYSKGLVYEWGGTFVANELVWDGCTITEVNKANTQGGDGIDLRGASDIKKLHVVNSTIYNGFRTFFRIDAAVILGEVKICNNTIMNLSKDDSSTNNNGILGVKAKPASFDFKNNLILYMDGNAKLNGPAAQNLNTSDLGIAYASNYFYGITAENFFNEKSSEADALAGGGKMLEVDPCYKAKAGIFNISDTDLINARIGAPKWLMAYNKKPEDLTMTVVEGTHNWDFTNPQYFLGTIDEKMVRDQLYMGVVDNKLNVSDDGIMQFLVPTTVNRSKLPLDGYLAFLVDKPGSVYVKPVNINDVVGNHVVIGMGDAEGKSITIKGGAAANTDNDAPQKIVIRDITEPSLVYVYASGTIGLEKLGWAYDTTPVNTALPTPQPSTAPSSFTAGVATDVKVSWKPVDNAGSYSVVFMGKTYKVEASEAPEYIIEGKTTGMLDAGSYKVEVFANPEDGDVYNTMSSAGIAAFAVLPKADAGDSELFVVNDSESLLAAIDAGKTEIYLAEGSYDIGKSLDVIAPLALIGQGTVNVNGAFVLSGEVGTFKVSNINFTDAQAMGCFITLANAGVTATEVVVENAVLEGYSKSVIYGSFDNANIDKIVVDGVQTKTWGTGQGIFDFRNGTYGSIVIKNSTITGGRDFIRHDATCVTGEIIIMHNTFDHVNNGVNGNGMFYVRSTPVDYKIVGNLFLNQTAESNNALSKTSGVQVPYMAGNFFYNCIDSFFGGLINKDVATGNNGVILTTDPVKDAANGDYTLTSALAMSCRVGAPKWNPSYAAGDQTCYVVTNAEEFQAAIDAGKTDIKFAASETPYDLSASSINITQPMHINGEVVNGKYPVVMIKQIDLAGEVGNLLIENLAFEGNGSDNFINVKEAVNARQIIVRNCSVNNIKKSLFYQAKEMSSTVSSLVFRNVYAKGFGDGQGTFDIRGGLYNNISVEHCTIVGGRDFIRADAGFVTGGINIDNNVFDGVNNGKNGNGILYVRSEGLSYSVKRNLFLNMTASSNTFLVKAGAQIPELVGNFYYNVNEGFKAGAFAATDTEEAKVIPGVFLPETNNPVRDAANGDYTLVDALCLSSNVGPACWNPNAGRVTTEWTVSNLEELITALDAGKTSISLNAGTYDFTAAPSEASAFSSGVLTLTAGTVLKGVSKAGVDPEIIGGIKLGEGVTHFTAQNIKFDGKEKSLGNAFEVSAPIDATNIIVRDCEIANFNKSLFYAGVDGATVNNVTLNRLLVHGMGTGQGIIDVRKPLFTAIVVENSTFFDGGRDFIRLDGTSAQCVMSASIRNNTFSNVSIDAANSILYVRTQDIDGKYTVENNLFLNEGGSTTVLAKSGCKVPAMNNNWFYNCTSENFWTGGISKEVATAGGGELEADPCANSAEGQFKLTNLEIKNAKVGDPRWW